MYMNMSEKGWEDAYIREICTATGISIKEALKHLDSAKLDLDYDCCPIQSAQNETTDWESDYYEEALDEEEI